MQIIAFSRWDEIVPHAESWDRLSGGVPFRSWAWQSTWWRHYGSQSHGDGGTRLMVLGVYDEADRLVGLAPWYLQRSRAKGQVLRWLGGGEVCSDYLGLLCQAHDADRVSEALADYLTGPDCGQGGPHAWDLMEIDGIAADDPAVTKLLERLVERKCTRHENTPVRCWRLALPESWDAYLIKVSKGHRKKLRHVDRVLFATGRARSQCVEDAGQLEKALDTLVELHQKRRQMLGEPGCFASRRFAAFHREAMQALLAAGQLQLFWLELDGRTIAIHYQMTGHGITYVYQAGIDTQRLAEEPGHLITAATIKRAIAHGGRAVDFLRGDEPYKPHFRAEPRAMLALRIVPNRPLPRLRNRLYLAGRQVKRWWTKTGPGYDVPLAIADSED
jgi:CelD/BcsL family acetyltransferase involved in cellulose biosynthesis